MDSYDLHENGLTSPTVVDAADRIESIGSPEVTRRVTRPRPTHPRLRSAQRGGTKVLFVASEVHPFARTGGLADVAGSLPKALAETGCEVAIATPFYSRLFPRSFRVQRLAEFDASASPLDRAWSLNRTSLDGRIPIYLPEQEEFFGRDHLYGNGTGDYPDNPERFAFFCRAVLVGLKAIGWRPDVIHCNDWQTGLVPLYLKMLARKDRFFDGMRTVFTVHNMAFPGTCPVEKLKALGLAGCDWRSEGCDRHLTDGLEFYGRVSLLKSGLVHSDHLTTVSPGYCREIQTAEHGCGFDGVMRAREGALSGILNGIDYDVWDPAVDPALVAGFDADNPTGKMIDKHAFQVSENLEVSSMPLASIVSRLTDQKGLDLVVEGIEALLDLPLQLAVIGEGERRYVELLTRIQARFPGRVNVRTHFEIEVAKRVYAASDIYLMPSRFEPCGLSELIGMRYGSVPVVRRTGGLADAVREFDPGTGSGNGFLFDDYSADSLVGAAKRAVTVYRNPEEWQRVRRNGMSEDFSWRRSVRAYKSIYESLLV